MTSTEHINDPSIRGWEPSPAAMATIIYEADKPPYIVTELPNQADGSDRLTSEQAAVLAADLSACVEHLKNRAAQTRA